MAALVVQSRFAGLTIEDDDYPSIAPLAQKKNKSNTAKKPESQKKPNIVTKKSQKSTNRKKKTKPILSSLDQWESWKQKDEELVDGNFESELQQAILLSKLEYEEKKDLYKQFKKEAELEKKIIDQSSKFQSKKQKKKIVMSLDQFNDFISGNDETKYNGDVEKDLQMLNDPDTDTNFFERIEDDTRNELVKVKINERLRHQIVSDIVITRSNFTLALEKKDKEIVALRQELTTLKQELLTVKTRNKKLCNILGKGEMKEKAEILIEVERLRAVQTELTAEIAALHTELEKERSKTTDSWTKDKKYYPKKKKIRFDVSSEAILCKDSSSETK